MEIWLKPLEITDDLKYYNVLMELANYENAYARPIPEKFGHTFVGWFLSDELECNIETIKTNTTLFAKWQKNNYQITFVSNDDQQKIETLSFEYNSDIEFPKFSKIGHSLAGWKTEDDNVFLTNSKMPADNIIIYAV